MVSQIDGIRQKLRSQKIAQFIKDPGIIVERTFNEEICLILHKRKTRGDIQTIQALQRLLDNIKQDQKYKGHIRLFRKIIKNVIKSIMIINYDNTFFNVQSIYHSLIKDMQSINIQHQLQFAGSSQEVLQFWQKMLRVDKQNVQKYPLITLVKYLAIGKDLKIIVQDYKITLNDKILKRFFGYQLFTKAKKVVRNISQIASIDVCQNCKKIFNQRDLCKTCISNHIRCRGCLRSLIKGSKSPKCGINTCKQPIDIQGAKIFLNKNYSLKHQQDPPFFSMQEQQQKKAITLQNKTQKQKMDSDDSLQVIFDSTSMKICSKCQAGKKTKVRAKNIIDLSECQSHKCQGLTSACYKCWGAFLRNNDEIKKICLHCNNELTYKQYKQIGDIVQRKEQELEFED